MAGHSKFKNIMHRKGAQDKKRAKVFTRLIKEIIVAAKSGLPDVAANPRLRAAVNAAKAENVPKDKIEAAIKRGSGSADTDNYEEIRYEGYGPGGVAIIVDALTDNRNRTASDVRSTFTKHGGNLGETGSVNFMFQRVGEIVYPRAISTEDGMLETAIEAGASDVESDNEHHRILTEMDSLHEVSAVLEARFGSPSSSRFAWIPQTMTPIDEEKAVSLFKLLDALDDLDDVQEVTSNADISEQIMQKLSA